MRILILGSDDDSEHLPRIAPLVKGSNVTAVKFKLTTPSMFAEIVQWCKVAEADAVIISNQVTMEFVLRAQSDFRAPTNRKELTLNDYQGSLLTISLGTRTIPAVVINPLANLLTVPYGKFLAQRFIDKLVNPGKFIQDIPFKWTEVTVDNAEHVCNRLSQSQTIAVDIETPTNGPWFELRGINCVGYAGLFTDKDTVAIECYVFPFAEWSYSFIRRINDNPIPKVTQNGRYDNAYFLRWGVPLHSWYWDTYHLFHSWLSELPKSLALVAAFSVRNIRYWKDDGKSGDLVDYYRYNALDCHGTLCSLLGILHDAPDWAINNYVEHEFPVVFPCIHMEMEGFRVDEEKFEEFYKNKKATNQKELNEIQTMVGSPLDPLPLTTKLVDGQSKPVIKFFNPNSPKQVFKVFEMFGLGVLGSTDKAAVLKAKAAHPLCDRVIGAIADWKSDAKIISNYLQEYKLWKLEYYDREGKRSVVYKRLLYQLDPGGTDSGRLASKASNFWFGFQIQNIPARDLSIKECLIADPGWVLGEGDFAQSEARCVGYLSGETKLIEVVEGPHDYHSWNASSFFGVAYESIYNDEHHKTLNKPLRDLSKRTNHGANYNMGDGVMLDTMGPKYVAEAKALLKLPHSLSLRKVCAYLLAVYEKTYPRVKGQWYEHIISTIRVSGMLVSPLGWTRKFFGRPHENKQHLNSAVAHEPQNLSVGIINKCLCALWKRQIYGDLKGIFRLKAQIHDSILFQFRREHPEVPGLVQAAMRFPVLVTDPVGITREMVIPCDMAAGKERWSELK